MQEKLDGQVRLFIRDQLTGRHMFNPEALLALGINLAEAQERGFQITPPHEIIDFADQTRLYLARSLFGCACEPHPFPGHRPGRYDAWDREHRLGPMVYKLKWRGEGAGPMTPETFNTEEQAKARARELLALHGQSVTIDIWNEDETWQIVTPVA